LLDEAPLVGEARDPRERPHGEVVAALRADPKGLVELVVPVVRMALRARVRVVLVPGRGVPRLDLHVDARLGHSTSLDLSPCRLGYRPSAGVSRSSRGPLAGAGAGAAR